MGPPGLPTYYFGLPPYVMTGGYQPPKGHSPRNKALFEGLLTIGYP